MKNFLALLISQKKDFGFESILDDVRMSHLFLSPSRFVRTIHSLGFESFSSDPNPFQTSHEDFDNLEREFLKGVIKSNQPSQWLIDSIYITIIAIFTIIISFQ
ncbi:chitin synthase 1 [Sarcoptes scabiei]|nr:chitin synthase 1 [Sarcoptes scabiei]